ncbi:MAG: hypothetical protein H7A13_08945 [Pseudomonadales bacterium]|nr:hypothetical protein [Pseudomonadales bacterium]
MAATSGSKKGTGVATYAGAIAELPARFLGTYGVDVLYGNRARLACRI